MAMSLQNVGTGIAVILGWRVDAGHIIKPNASLEELQADPVGSSRPIHFSSPNPRLVFAPHDLSFWQAAIRTPGDPDRARIEAAIAGPDPLLIDLLYGDQEGGQRTISRFSIARYGGADDGWFPAVVNHWYT